jgi:predicted flap endonuclease-1-like 5' DNA nuclease
MTQPGDPKPGSTGRSGDDFRKIEGVGRKFEQRLWDAGIFTYKDLARRTPEEIAAVLAPMAGISPERIASQARELAGSPLEASVPRQHYAAFHVEFLLESDNSVRRTKVHQHQTDARDAWSGWDEERLLSFLRDRIPLPAAATPADAPGVEPTQTQADESAQTQTDESAQTQTKGQVPANVEPASADQPSGPVPDRLPSLSLSIEELAPIRDGQHNYVLSPNEPSSVRLTMRINPIGAPIHDTFDFSATIVARRFAGHDRSPLGTTHGAIRARDPVSVEVTGPALPPDLYRLLVTVEIYPAGHSPEEPPLFRMRASGDFMRVANAPLGPVATVA